ncbi:unnamed protein product [Dicrocoelium dendriticum]|nr:unnamed protein product [Dicrocoelium dendriticum]
MMLLRAFQFWQKARSEGWEKSYCQKNYISSAAFETITIIRTQLLGQLRASGFVKARGCGDIRDLNTNSENWAVVKAAIVSGMYPNFARVDKERERLERIACRTNESVHLHPHSVLAISNNGSPLRYSCLPSGWLVYDEHICIPNAKEHLADATTMHGIKEELAAHSSSERPQSGADRQDLFHDNFDGVWEKTTHTVIRCATIVSPITIALIGGPMRLRSDILNEVENDAQGM